MNGRFLFPLFSFDFLFDTEIGLFEFIKRFCANPEAFDLDIYSAVYDASGEIVNYQKVTYPNCTGNPFGVGAQDDTFYVGSITIDSAPATGQAPYSIETVDKLPAVL